MLSKQQYLSDQGMSWHPHLMFLLRATQRKSGGNLPGIAGDIAANDPERTYG